MTNQYNKLKKLLCQKFNFNEKEITVEQSISKYILVSFIPKYKRWNFNHKSINEFSILLNKYDIKYDKIRYNIFQIYSLDIQTLIALFKII